jgi:hypothetical protein
MFSINLLSDFERFETFYLEKKRKFSAVLTFAVWFGWIRYKDRAERLCGSEVSQQGRPTGSGIDTYNLEPYDILKLRNAFI